MGRIHLLARAVSPILAWLCLAWVVLGTALVMQAAYTAVPFDDEWLDHVMPEWSVLAAQFNEHVILTARLVLMADQAWFSYTRVFPLLLILGVQVVHAWILVRLYRDGTQGSAPVLAWPLALCLLLCAYQWENFVWAFQLQFVLVGMAASLAFFLLARWPSGLLSALLAIVAAAASLYSMANGLLALLLLVSLALCLRRPWHEVLLLALAAAGLIALYWSGYHYGGGHAGTLWQQWPRLAGGLLNYLGLPVASTLPEAWQRLPGWDIFHAAPLLAGALAVLLALLATLSLWLRRSQLRPGHWALWHVVLFVGLSAVVTSAGRGGDTFVSRYGTPALVGWVAVLLLLDALWAQAAVYRRCRLALLGLGVLALLFALQQSTYLQPALERARMMRGFETALLAQVDDRQRLSRMNAAYQWPRMQPILQHWKERRLGVYADPWATWLGTPLQQHLAPQADDTRCRGSLGTAVIPIEAGGAYAGAWRVAGVLSGTTPVDGRILLVDDDGTVVGYALTAYPPLRWHAVPQQQEWSGHAGLAHATAIHAMVWMADGTACRIASSVRLDPASAVQTVEDPAVDPLPLPMEEAADGGWTLATPVSSPYTAWPLGGSVLEGRMYSTDPAQVASDPADLRWRSHWLPMMDAIVIRVFTAMYGDDLSLRVVDPDTGQVLGEVPDLATFSIGWRNWRLPVPQDGRAAFRIEIQASDRSHQSGKAWGGTSGWVWHSRTACVTQRLSERAGAGVQGRYRVRGVHALTATAAGPGSTARTGSQ